MRLARLAEDAAERVRVKLEVLRDLLADDALDNLPHLGVTQPGLGLALKLGLGHPHRDDRAQALADVLAAQVSVRLLQQLRLPRLSVHRARERLL